jgi:hypothetical protein
MFLQFIQVYLYGTLWYAPPSPLQAMYKMCLIDNDRDLVDACTDKLVVRQKTASYSNNYMLNAEKSLKKT